MPTNHRIIPHPFYALAALALVLTGGRAAAQEAAPTPRVIPPSAQVVAATDSLCPPAASTAPAGAPETRAAEHPPQTERPAGERIEVELGYSYEDLTNGFAPWRSAHLFVGKKFASRQSLYGTYRETSRVNLRDREGMVGFYQPLGRRWAVLAESQFSPTHRVLPKWSALVQVERNFGRGWVASAGYRRTLYNTARVNTGAFTVERYFSRYRAAYTLYASGLEGAGTSASHRGQFNYYFGEGGSTLGVSVAAGRELENLGARVLRSGVRSVAAQGRHWFNPRWGVNCDFTLHRQGDFYARRGLSVGLRHRF